MNYYEGLKMDVLEQDDVRTRDSADTVEQLICQVKREDTYIDVGAHIGLIALPVIFHARPRLSILIEPNDYARNLMEKFIRDNVPDSNVIILDGMVRDYDGEGDFYRTESSPHGSAFPLHVEGTITKKAMRLDSVIKENGIAGDVVLKCDAEGGDAEVWRSLGEKVRMIKFAVLEFHPRTWQVAGEDKDLFVDSARSNGFALATLRGKPLLENDSAPYSFSDKSNKVDIVLTRKNE